MRRLLVGICGCAMLYVFFVQVRISLRIVPVSLERTDVAYGYTTSNVTFSGRVYLDQGETAAGAGIGVAFHINGTAESTTDTDENGDYEFTSLTLTDEQVLSVFINGETEKGAIIVKVNEAELSDKSVTGMDIYKDHLILKTSTTDLGISTADLSTADDDGDADLAAVYTLSGNDLTLGPNTNLYIPENNTFTTSGDIYTHDLTILGTLTHGSNDISASGSVIATGTLSSTGDMKLTSVNSSETLNMGSNTLQNLIIDNGIIGFWKFDEGTSQTVTSNIDETEIQGTFSGGVSWSTNTPPMAIYNPHAIAFDGTDGRIDFGNTLDITDGDKRTFTGWFVRDSDSTDDVLIAKKENINGSDAGYALYLDNSTDKLVFVISDGTDTYTVSSSSTITDTSWHHFSVSWNTLSSSDAQMVIDGNAQTESTSGTFGNIGSVTNAQNFSIGAESDDGNPFGGTIDDVRIYNRILSLSESQALYNGNKSTGVGVYTLSGDIDINGNLEIYSGELDVSNSDYAIHLAGNLLAHGMLDTQSGTIILDGVNQSIYGSTRFQELQKSTTSAYTLTLQANAMQTVSGALTLQSSVGNRLNIISTRTGSQSYLIAEDENATMLKHLEVLDNSAWSGATLTCTEGCVDNGNTTNWVFGGICGDAVENDGEECDDGNISNTDACLNSCVEPVCGDGYVQSGAEQCEPPNTASCQNNCLFRTAGGGTGGGSSGEDSGGSQNTKSGSYYQRPDPPEGCGNGILQPSLGEECDEGLRNNGIGICSYDCKILFCGDGIVSPFIGEDCEPETQEHEDGYTVFVEGICGEVCTIPTMTSHGTQYGGCKRQFLPECISENTDDQEKETIITPSECGNGIQEDGEQCDFGGICKGGDFDGSIWTDEDSANTCKAVGGIPEATSGDGCSDTCQLEFCGDGIVQLHGKDGIENTEDDEICDNGMICSDDQEQSCLSNTDCKTGECIYNVSVNTQCTSNCKEVSTSQDYHVQVEESQSEIQAVCGDGKIDSSEKCDEGILNGIQGSNCTRECTIPDAFCGDGVVNTGEECDDGPRNSDTFGSQCRTDCSLPFCGDGIQDIGEQCDSGIENSDIQPDACRTDCSLPTCGDNVQDSGEICDGGLFCAMDCQSSSKHVVECGNNIQEYGEECDDGNKTPNDGCSTICTIEYPSEESICGNGIHELGEECDDGNLDETDTCTKECTSQLVLDADVLFVNPTDIANAIKFDPIKPKLTMKGTDALAEKMREAALRQGIPIIKIIALARAIYSSTGEGEYVAGTVEEDIYRLMPVIGINTLSIDKPEEQNSLEDTLDVDSLQNTMPSAPHQLDQNQYAQLTPLVENTAPLGDTGPSTAFMIALGAAGGISWVRKRTSLLQR